MLNSIIAILVGIILFLIGIVINLSVDFSTDIYWIGVGLLLSGILIILISVIGKIKQWF